MRDDADRSVQTGGAPRACKTVLDYGLALPAIVLLSPVMAVLALLVRLDSPGPAFHRRRVVGVGGRPFIAYKLRTMAVDGEEILARRPDLLEELERTHKLKDDPRVTRIGHWLRRFSLDELPQLYNVIRGEMSLVGPRMISPEELEKYGEARDLLLTVKPGLTGLWQVSGRSDLSYEDRVRLDKRYITDYSFRRDLRILFLQTVPAVLKRRGAY
jgi:lipopolysaccharide/colanic/teichoic acid biosynthesis glycosyltransferase